VSVMKQCRQRLAKDRSDTDVKLLAERAGSDINDDLDTASTRQVLDDLIDQDRILADARLLKFRKTADNVLSRERSNLPSPSRFVASERDSADQRQFIEREMSDTLLERERQRSDAAVGKERSEHDEVRIGLEVLRQSTNDQLSSERDGADMATTALGASQEALAHAEKDRVRQDDVLGFVAHDLRSPLCVISISAESIAHTTLDSGIRLSAIRASRAVARMDRLLADLLDVVRIHAGSLSVHKRQHDVSTLMTEVFDTYAPLFSARDIAFCVDMEPESIVAPFDHDRIVQVLSNLLSNAMKFTPHGGHVTLQVQREPKQVQFALQDDGPGIHPSAAPLVFKRFWQIDSTTRRGLGLGLHIAEEIVNVHGGRIWVETVFGKGTTFKFTLPFGAEHDSSSEQSGEHLPALTCKDAMDS
jgi:signal transduction histidine kinase